MMVWPSNDFPCGASQAASGSSCTPQQCVSWHIRLIFVPTGDLQVQIVQQKLAVACTATADALRARLVAQRGYAALLRALAGLMHSGSPGLPERSGEVAAALQDARVSLTGTVHTSKALLALLRQ